MAVGAPRRALSRRIKAPTAVLLCIAPWAARRNIPAARFLVFLGLGLRSLPPLMRLSGQTLSQAQKCFSLFQQFMSKPHSDRGSQYISQAVRKPLSVIGPIRA